MPWTQVAQTFILQNGNRNLTRLLMVCPILRISNDDIDILKENYNLLETFGLSVDIALIFPKKADLECISHELETGMTVYTVSQLGSGYYNAVNVVWSILETKKFDHVCFIGGGDRFMVKPRGAVSSFNPNFAYMHDVWFRDSRSNIVRRWCVSRHTKFFPFLIPHIGTFFPVRHLKIRFDEKYRVAGDLLWIFKIHSAGIIFLNSDTFRISMAPNGLSRPLTLDAMVLKLKEVFGVYSRFGLKGGMWLVLNFLFKISQFFTPRFSKCL